MSKKDGVSINLFDNSVYSNYPLAGGPTFTQPQSLITFNTFIPLVIYKYKKFDYVSSIELASIDENTREFIIQEKPNREIVKVVWP